MRIHAIQTGRVQIKASQIVGRGHGLSASPRAADRQRVVGLAADLRLRDRASRRRDPRRHRRLRRPQAPAALASLLPLCRALRHRAGRGSRASAAGDRHRPGRRQARRPDPPAHRSRRRARRVSRRAKFWSAPASLRRRPGLAGRLRGYLPQRWPKSFDPKPLVLDDGAYGPFARSRRLTADGAIVAVRHARPHARPSVGHRRGRRRGRLHRRRRVVQRGDDARRSDRRRQRRRRRRGGDARRHPDLRRGEADDLPAGARSGRGAKARRAKNDAERGAVAGVKAARGLDV